MLASVQGVHLWKEAVLFEGSSDSCIAHFGITYRLRTTRKQCNTIIHTGGNIKVVFLFFQIAFYSISYRKGFSCTDLELRFTDEANFNLEYLKWLVERIDMQYQVQFTVLPDIVTTTKQCNVTRSAPYLWRIGHTMDQIMHVNKWQLDRNYQTTKPLSMPRCFL